MVLTFGQYSTLAAIRRCVTREQLAAQTSFDQLMVKYYIMVLLNSGLVVANYDEEDNDLCYQLTEAGIDCIHDYERSNPELTIRRMIS
jgi:predicted transcriptional regulator